MKDQKSALRAFIAVVSLIAIAAVLASGFLKKKDNEGIKNETGNSILGETTESKEDGNPVLLNAEKFIGDTFQNTKEVAEEKVSEVQKTVIATVEKEVSELTKSQVESLKLQICRDWGVVP